MRRDERLIDLFLRGYKDQGGSSYCLKERPDHAERDRPAIDERGASLAVERTLMEPFEGKMADDRPFLTVFERLHHSTELTVPNVLIDILVPVRRFLLGSVTAKVLHNCGCPVWTAAHPEGEAADKFESRNVLCAVDFGPHR